MLRESTNFFALAEQGSLSGFGYLLAFLVGGMAFAAVGLLASRLLGPFRPNPEKLSSYECGEDPVGSAGIQFHARFYLVGLVFLIFEVEILFLFPWATVYADAEWIAAAPAWGWLALAEILAFATILILGLAYVWQRGDLDWVQPRPLISEAEPIASSPYAAVNERYRKVTPRQAPALEEA